MPVGYRNSAGVDFDDLFDPDVQGNGPTASFLRTAAGVAVRYADITYGSKGPNVGYRTSAGVDVSNLWAAKGTATYVTDGGVPGNLSTTLTVAPSDLPVTTALGITFHRNGSVTWSAPGGGSGTWVQGGSTVGDDYDVRYDQSSAPTGQGVWSAGNLGTWQRVNASRNVGLSLTMIAGQSVNTSGRIRFRIRRRSDNAVLVDRTATMNILISTTS